jgi:hypothetical protein
LYGRRSRTPEEEEDGETLDASSSSSASSSRSGQAAAASSAWGGVRLLIESKEGEASSSDDEKAEAPRDASCFSSFSGANANAPQQRRLTHTSSRQQQLSSSGVVRPSLVKKRHARIGHRLWGESATPSEAVVVVEPPPMAKRRREAHASEGGGVNPFLIAGVAPSLVARGALDDAQQRTLEERHRLLPRLEDEAHDGDQEEEEARRPAACTSRGCPRRDTVRGP